jgi:hypothetical protein
MDFLAIWGWIFIVVVITVGGRIWRWSPRAHLILWPPIVILAAAAVCVTIRLNLAAVVLAAVAIVWLVVAWLLLRAGRELKDKNRQI